MNQRYAIIDAFCIITRRPGETDATIEGIRDQDAGDLPMLTCDDGVADAIEAELDRAPLVAALMSYDTMRIDLVATLGWKTLTDGCGRHFQLESRRPVDIHGNPITLPQQEHQARNWTRARDARERRAA